MYDIIRKIGGESLFLKQNYHCLEGSGSAMRLKQPKALSYWLTAFHCKKQMMYSLGYIAFGNIAGWIVAKAGENFAVLPNFGIPSPLT